MNSKKWIRIWFVIIITIPIVGLFNYLIDPYGLNSNRNKFDLSLTDISKANILNLKINLQADYYLIGTSRLIRVSPIIIENYFLDKKVFNIGISAATFKDNLMLAKKVISKNSNFIFGFDTFTLNKSRLNNNFLINRYETYKEALTSNNTYSEYFSLDFLITSFADIYKRISGEKLNQFFISENIKDINITLDGVEKFVKDIGKDGISNFNNFETISEKDIIQLAKLASKDDIFIIYPKHYYHYLLNQKYQNIEEKYFRAIEILVNNTNAKVWSFYQINNITKNEKNFDENGWHFKPKIANMIFARIYEDNITLVNSNNFGILLTKDNVQQNLSDVSRKIKNYNLY
tara:strand:+ start:747 stop:1784 length:1038 start_codon:yes stop_codon:yes gene_type:complete